MVNLVGSWNPDRHNRVVIGAHYDTRPFPDEDPDPAMRKAPFIGANDGASGRIDLGDGLATGIEPGMGPVAHGPKGRRGSVWRDGRQVRLTV